MLRDVLNRSFPGYNTRKGLKQAINKRYSMNANTSHASHPQMNEPDTPAASKVTEIFIDADACPVKEEVYRVARRYALKVWVVSNGGVRVPPDPLIQMVVVEAGPDIADNWIVERVDATDIVVTSDIPLAHRCLQKHAEVIGPTGKPFTPNSIGTAMAQRSIMEHLRASGEITGGPKPFSSADRSKFLQALDEAVNRQKRKPRPA